MAEQARSRKMGYQKTRTFYRIAMKTPDETLLGLRTYRKKSEALVRAGTIRCAWAGLFKGATFKVVKA